MEWQDWQQLGYLLRWYFPHDAKLHRFTSPFDHASNKLRPLFITPLVHPSKLRCFLFAPCVTQTPPLTACLVHPIELHRFILAPCVIQTPPFCAWLVHPSKLYFLFVVLTLVFLSGWDFLATGRSSSSRCIFFLLWGGLIEVEASPPLPPLDDDETKVTMTDSLLHTDPRCETPGKRREKLQRKFWGGIESNPHLFFLWSWRCQCIFFLLCWGR